MPDFIPGLLLCKRFFQEAVQPAMQVKFSDLRYSAALIGSGSDVLGFDTEMSTDHDWGPRLQIFLTEKAMSMAGDELSQYLQEDLPISFLGYATRYVQNPDGTHRQEKSGLAPTTHRIELHTLSGFFFDYLGFDLNREIQPSDWLTFPEQKLLGIQAGAVYRDDIGLAGVRERFAYYPRDVWFYLLAACWTRIGEEEHLMGRAGYAGDELGSSLIASRIVRDLIRLCFLMERRYCPYPKWFGAGFARLNCCADMLPLLLKVQNSATWQEREELLCQAYAKVADMHNALKITPALPREPGWFHNRPFRVIHLHGGFADVICQQIQDKKIKRLLERRVIGGIDLISDSTALLCDPIWREPLRTLYEY